MGWRGVDCVSSHSAPRLEGHCQVTKRAHGYSCRPDIGVTTAGRRVLPTGRDLLPMGRSGETTTRPALLVLG